MDQLTQSLTEHLAEIRKVSERTRQIMAGQPTGKLQDELLGVYHELVNAAGNLELAIEGHEAGLS